MSEAEKQESQKTVVAFITGLLIGGLLVWVFSSSPKNETVQGVEEATTEKSADTNVTANSETKTVTASQATETAATKEVTGKGSVSVVDQKAGSVVTLAKSEFPTKNGWVVVRDYMDGVPGNILGASRYGADEGLVPTEVSLLRNTAAGSSYQVVFYTDNGDKVFDLGDDTVIDGISTTFKAN
jgi:hypothetical protein